jgi:serine/threonine protein kinase
MGVDEIWLEVAPLHGAARERKLEELSAGDADLAARVRALLPTDEESTGPRLEPPCRLGPYGLLERIAGGAHGDVYRATREDLEGQVALKVLRRLPGTSALVSEVRREASSARRIPSEHVVAVHGAGQIPGGPGFIEMALCADPDPMHPGAIRMGTSLRHEALGPGGPRLPVLEAARLVEAACRGTEAAHRTGIIHGDIKPENVLVTPISRRVMLADFGIATTMARHDGATAPDGKVRSGTLAYMAPEQFNDGRAPDVQSDVYMLGGTLLFALTGEVPHPGRRLGAEGIVDAPRTAVPAYVPQRLAEIAERALATNPEERYRSAGEMAEQLRLFRERLPTYDDEPQLSRRLRLFAERHASVLLALGAALAVSALLGLTGWRSFIGIVRDREAQLRELEGRQAALDADGERLHAANAELSEKRAALEAQVAGLEERIDDSRRPLKELPKVRADLAAARADLQAREQALAEARAEARARADDAEAARRVAEEKAARLQGALTASERTTQRVEAELDRTRDQLERRFRLEAERDAARERAASLEARVTSLERQGAVLEERLDAATHAAEDLRSKLREAERRAAAAAAAVRRPAVAPGAPAAPPAPPAGSTGR